MKFVHTGGIYGIEVGRETDADGIEYVRVLRFAKVETVPASDVVPVAPTAAAQTPQASASTGSRRRRGGGTDGGS